MCIDEWFAPPLIVLMFLLLLLLPVLALEVFYVWPTEVRLLLLL